MQGPRCARHCRSATGWIGRRSGFRIAVDLDAGNRFGASGSQGARCRAPHHQDDSTCAAWSTTTARNSGCRRHRGAREQPRGHHRHRAAHTNCLRLRRPADAQCQGCCRRPLFNALAASLGHWSRPTDPIVSTVCESRSRWTCRSTLNSSSSRGRLHGSLSSAVFRLTGGVTVFLSGSRRDCHADSSAPHSAIRKRSIRAG